MRKYFVAAALLFSLIFSTNAFSQGGFFGTVTGTVTDSTGALIPGVNIKATATDTGVVTTTLSNETGAYNFANLLPGKYTFTASLTGLTTQNITDAVIGANQLYRYNFKMGVSASATTVDVSISAQNIIATSGATIGQALSEQKVHDLPLVGNNVLNLLSTLSGVEGLVGTNGGFGQNNAFGREGTTLAGVSASEYTHRPRRRDCERHALPHGYQRRDRDESRPRRRSPVDPGAGRCGTRPRQRNDCDHDSLWNEQVYGYCGVDDPELGVESEYLGEQHQSNSYAGYAAVSAGRNSHETVGDTGELE